MLPVIHYAELENRQHVRRRRNPAVYIERRGRQKEAPPILLLTNLGQPLQVPKLANRLAPQRETEVVDDCQ